MLKVNSKKPVMRKLFFTAIAAFTLFFADAQTLTTPQPSPSQTIKQNFALGSVEITYSRPGIKGRKIFGGLVPFEKYGGRAPMMPMC